MANGCPKAREVQGFLFDNWSQVINILPHEFRGQGYILRMMTQDFHHEASCAVSRVPEERKGV